VELGGLRLTGIGGAGPARFGFCYEWSEEDIDNRIVFAADLLLCHCPPNGLLDRTKSGEQVGSLALRRIARAHQGVYVCGHIHEAGGVGRLGDCLLLNAGGLGAPFGAAQVGFVHGRDGVRWEHLDRGEADEAER
jgi:Icc-related predicted phosphoesterase